MTQLEIELSKLETRAAALQGRLEYLRTSQDLRRKMPLRLAVLEDEVAITESQIKRFRAYWSF